MVRYELGVYGREVDDALAAAVDRSYVTRIWSRDASLWKDEPGHARIISNALGWLTVADQMLREVDDLASFCSGVRRAGLRATLLLGMGGSSLAPEVCALTFGVRPGFLPLKVLDTTDPAIILDAERSARLPETLFLVSSKSGTTIESASLEQYFFEKLARSKGERAGENFVAITDPGTALVEVGRQRGLRRVFLNPRDIGGRYSALSYFGLVPMALLGIDVRRILEGAIAMAERCRERGPDNPGLRLGVALGALAREGRDKVTFLLSPEIASFGYWLEQLIAESTGKEETGILPVEGEPLGEPPAYGPDRVFVSIEFDASGSPAPALELDRLARAGHPLIRLPLAQRDDLGGQFFLWEFATAVASAVLGINPFDQPNVQESKDNTGRLIREFETSGRLAAGAPAVVEREVAVTASSALAGLATDSAAGMLRSVLPTATPGRDYVALLAYVPRTPHTAAALERIRTVLRDRTCLATTTGFGPRYLHSTGQFHKGGPNTGIFLQITSADVEDMSIPGAVYSFGTLKAAQALGDFKALDAHRRRVLRFDLGSDVEKGLKTVAGIVDEALG